MKKFFDTLVDSWQPLLLATISIICCFFVYSFRLGTLVKGYSTLEISSVASSSSGRKILNNPINLPHKASQYALWKTNHTGVTAMRSVSVVFAIISIILFYYIINRWHTTRVAVLTTLVFATSSWLLHIGRSASPDILLILLPLLLIATGIYIRRSSQDIIAVHIGATIAAICMYIPYGFIYIMPILLWRSKSFFKGKLKPTWWLQVSSVSTFFLFLSPLIYAVIKTPSIISGLLRLPVDFPPLSSIWSTIASAFLSISVRSIDLSPEAWLSSIPILSVGSSVLLVLGVYTYIGWFRLQRTKLFFLEILVGFCLIGLSMSVSSISVVIPVLYLLIGGGITYLLKEWFIVFPRNPIARNIGASFVSILLLLIAFYNVNSYFIAWPLNPNTQKAFTSIKHI